MLPWVTGLEADVLPRESFNSDEFKEIFSKHAYLAHYPMCGSKNDKSCCFIVMSSGKSAATTASWALAK